jgi:hypothetical protein
MWHNPKLLRPPVLPLLLLLLLLPPFLVVVVLLLLLLFLLLLFPLFFFLLLLLTCFSCPYSSGFLCALLLQKKQNDLRPHTPYKQQESEYLSAPK